MNEQKFSNKKVKIKTFFTKFAVLLFKQKTRPYERLLRVYLWFIFAMFFICSLLLVVGAIGSIVYLVIRDKEGISYTDSPYYYSLYWMLIWFVVTGSAFKALFFFLTFTFYALLPYSSIAQSVYLQDKERLNSSGEYTIKSVYYITCGFPFWEVFMLLRDPLPFLTRLIRGESVSVPNYPAWYDPNDTDAEKIRKLKISHKLARAARKQQRVKRRNEISR